MNQANDFTSIGSTRRIMKATANNANTGPKSSPGFTSKALSATSRDTNPPRLLICHQISPNPAKTNTST